MKNILKIIVAIFFTEWPVEPVKEDPKTRGISPLELLVLVMMVMALSMLIMGTVLCAMVYKTLAVSIKNFIIVNITLFFISDSYEIHTNR